MGTDKIISGGKMNCTTKILAYIKMTKSHLIVLSLTIYGLLFSGTFIDSSYFIPFVLKNANPQLYPTDLFVNSQEAYHSLFFQLMGYFCKFINWEVLFSVLHFLVSFGIALFTFYIAEVLFENKITSYLTVFLFLVGKLGISLTGFGVIPVVFEPSTVARFFSLFSIYLFLKEKYPIACLITGLMFYIQPVEAFSVSAMFMACFLINSVRGNVDINLTRAQILKSISLLVLSTLPIIWKFLQGEFFEQVSQETVNKWLSIIHFRSFYHYFPFSWGPGDFFNYSGWFLWLFIVLKYSTIPKKHSTVMIFCKSIALLCLIGTIFTEIIPVPFVIKLVLWRSTAFFVFFLIVYISYYLVNLPTETFTHKLLIAGTIAAMFFSLYRLIVCFALLHLGVKMYRKFFSFIFTVSGCIGIVTFCVGSFLKLESNSFLINKFFSFINLGRQEIILFLIMSVFLVYLLHLRTTEKMQFTKIKAISCAAFFILLVLIKSHLTRNISQEKEKFKKYWKETQLWAKENSSSEDVFITPPYLEGFRIHSQVGVVVECKDGAVANGDINFGIKWWDRMNDLGYKNLSNTILNFVPECKRNYESLTEKEIINLSDKYGAKYVVVEKPKSFNLRLVYENERFCIYSIK